MKKGGGNALEELNCRLWNSHQHKNYMGHATGVAERQEIRRGVPGEQVRLRLIALCLNAEIASQAIGSPGCGGWERMAYLQLFGNDILLSTRSDRKMI